MKVRYDILYFNYWEHIKYEKEIIIVLGAEHPKCQDLRKVANDILVEVHELANKIKKTENLIKIK